MIAELGATEQGCLLFADITGYTKYIGATEITHAQDVIADLIETIVEVVTPTFEISRIEGDAAFAFQDSGRLTPAMVLDTVDSTYFAFRRRLRDVVHATTCPCQACIRIPSLDLKFFLHEGEYAVRRVAGFKELSGFEVIVLHRLAKGSASSVVDGHAYAVYTKAIIETMGVDPESFGLVPHAEEFDDTGQIDIFVQDLETRWLAEEQSVELIVATDQARLVTSFETPAPPQVVWDVLTDPEKRPNWQHGVTEVIATTGGRLQAGSVNHCMHGKDVTIEHIADWRPFSHLTLSYDIGDAIKGWLWTYRLEPTDAGTKLTTLAGDPGDAVWAEMGPTFTEVVETSAANLEKVLSRA